MGSVILAFILINSKCGTPVEEEYENPSYGPPYDYGAYYGSIKGIMKGAKTNKVLPNAGIVLGKVTGEGICTIQGQFVTSTNSINGEFTFYDVPVGTYVVFYNSSNEYLSLWRNLGGTQIYYGLLGKQESNSVMGLPTEFLTSFAGFGSGGGIIITPNTSITFENGKIIDVDGSFGSMKYHFYIDYHDGNPFTISVSKNTTTNVTFSAWNL